MALRGKILSKNPLVIISSIRHPFLLGIASKFPASFSQKKSLHLLSPAWSVLKQVDALKKEMILAKTTIPNARFIVLANEEAELIELQAHGIFSIPANASMFVNEQDFKPKPNTPITFSAIYNAALQPYKNHYLCKGVNNLALIYYVWANDERTEAYGREMRELLGGAAFLNDTQGQYRRLSYSEIAFANSQSAVGLCLSSVEGTMRAAVEYLLCGTPVVSIPSFGGRQRYFNSENSIIVPPDPDSVAVAVRQLQSRQLSREAIRSGILSILNFERSNFLRLINHVFLKQWGLQNRFESFEEFRDTWTYRSWEQWDKYLQDIN
jgi:glycosyltransferase involved in cell wall biosynthesis